MECHPLLVSGYKSTTKPTTKTTTMLLSLIINLFPLVLMFRERFHPKAKQKHVPKIEPAPNPWLVSYVSSQQAQRSRYEIDLYLLKQGYPAAEIEAAWETLAPR